MQRCVLLTIGLVLAVGTLGVGGQFLVDTDGSAPFRSIQGAIDAAGYGDTIIVRPGIYEEQLELKAGITVRGSGTGATVVRLAYGYEPLVAARNVSQCTVEDLTLERAPSLLSAETVSIVNASVTFHRCRVTGGSVGIDISGSVGRVVFTQGMIDGNTAQAVTGGAGTRIEVTETSITGNLGGGIAIRNGTELELANVTVSGNGGHGVFASGTRDVIVSNCTVSGNDGTGLRFEGNTAAQLVATHVAGNLGHAMQSEDNATVTCSQCNFRGGEGIAVAGHSRIDLRESTLLRMDDPAIHWADSSIGALSRVSILDGEGAGAIVTEQASVTIEHATIAGNEGTGVSVAGGTLGLMRSIVALNRAYGIEVRTPGVLHSESNNVWGNASGEVAGGSLRVDDLSVPPSFVSLEDGDVSLRADSGCLLATAPGGALGSAIDPRTAAGIYGGIVGSWTSAIDRSRGLEAAVRLAVDGGWSSNSSGTATVTGALRWPNGDLTIAADRSPAGTLAWSGWFHWDSAMRIGTLRPDEPADVSLALSTDLAGRLSGRETWLLADATASLAFDPVVVDIGVSQSFPIGSSIERLSVAVVGSSWTWGALLTMRDFSPVRGELLFDWAWTSSRLASTDDGSTIASSRLGSTDDGSTITSPRRGPALSGSICLFPTISGQAEVTIALPRGMVALGGMWGVDDPLRLSLAAADDLLGMDVDISWIQAREASDSMQLVIEAGKALSWGMLRGRAVLGRGVRLELNVTIEFDALQANRPPVAEFDVLGGQSDDPLTLWLDGAASSDPDGDELTYTWLFGDGETASGVVVAHTFPAPGTYPVVLTVTDEHGAVSQRSRELDVEREASDGTAARFSWRAEDATGRAREGPTRIGDTLIVDAGLSSSPDGIIEFSWDVAGDGVIELRTAVPVARLPLTSEGPIAVVLRVTDASGRTGVISDVVDVVPQATPTSVAAYSPAVPLVDETVSFTDLSTDADGIIVGWSWLFGDGHQSSEQHPLHTFTEAGAYDVTLEVTDHEGLTDASHLVLEVISSADAVVPSDVWALVIGISDYESVNDLQYAREDAVAAARWILGTGVPADHLRLLLDRQGSADEIGGRSSETADLLRVREALGWLRKEASEDDLVIVWFSGHGALAEDDDGDEADGWDELLVLHDTIAGAEAETALRDDELAAFVARIPSQRIVLLLDTCFSGGAEAGGRTIAEQRPTGDAEPSSGETARWTDLVSSSTVILAAAGEGQAARESEALQHGVFTHFFLEGMAGGADANGDARVTVAEAAQYASPRVDAFVMSWLGVHQQPEVTGQGDPAIVLTRLP